MLRNFLKDPADNIVGGPCFGHQALLVTNLIAAKGPEYIYTYTIQR